MFSNAAATYQRLNLDAAGTALERLWNAHRFYEGIAGQVDPSLDRRRENLILLMEGQAAASTVERSAQLGQVVFGASWRGLRTEWRTLRAAADWIRGNLDIHQLAARVADRAALADRCDIAAEKAEGFVFTLSQLLTDLRVDETAALVIGQLPNMPLAELAEHLAAWRDSGEQLSKWVAYRSRARRGSALGLADVVARLHEGKLEPDHALAQFEFSYFEAVLDAQVAAVPDLAHFDGDLHSRAVRSFVDLDRQRIQHAAMEVVQAHHRRIPPQAGGALGPLGVLKSEIARRRGHMPIRKPRGRQPIDRCR
ncbi:MAG TPA: hypothetical protein VHW66_00870 [Stellaceae bacterium]|nr:hypothetical protein [Stellaceae bacterium]